MNTYIMTGKSDTVRHVKLWTAMNMVLKTVVRRDGTRSDYPQRCSYAHALSNARVDYADVTTAIVAVDAEY